MDFVSSVISSEQSLDKFPFSSSSSSSSSCTNPSCQQQHNALARADAFLLAPSPPLCNVAFATDFPTAEVGLAAENNNKIDDDGDNDRARDCKRKKTIHRDAEKKRRHEMAALHRSLRSLLPVEHLKGKRAMSDQVDEAVNYIRHLQKRNEELRHKRDELKERLAAAAAAAAALNERSQSSGKVGVGSSSGSSKCSSSSASEEQQLQGSSSSSSARVEISSGNKLVQVVVSTAIEGGIPASTLLKTLFQQHQGLSLITCISTTHNQTLLIHTIHSQVNEEDSSIIDPSELQKRLADLITSTS